MLNFDAVIRSLKTHKIELNEAPEESNRKGKSIALKSTQRKLSSLKAMKAVGDSDSDEDEMNPLTMMMMRRMKLLIWQGEYQKLGLRERRRKVLSLKRTKREKQSQMKSFALSAKNLDMSD